LKFEDRQVAQLFLSWKVFPALHCPCLAGSAALIVDIGVNPTPEVLALRAFMVCWGLVITFLGYFLGVFGCSCHLVTGGTILKRKGCVNWYFFWLFACVCGSAIGLAVLGFQVIKQDSHGKPSLGVPAIIFSLGYCAQFVCYLLQFVLAETGPSQRSPICPL
jgi:drug/metabolite transporter (DMT)-like permease